MRLRSGHRTLPVLAIFAVALLAVLGARPMAPATVVATGSIAQTYSLSGTVRDSATNEPVAGVLVSIAPGFVAATGADGVYSFSGLPPGAYTLTPAKGGGFDAVYSFQPPSRTVTLMADTSGQDFTARREVKSYLVSVVVRNPAGNPIPGITMLFTGAQEGRFKTTGRSDVLNLPAGTYTFFARERGYQFLPSTVTINVPLVTSVELLGRRMIALPFVRR
jgi:hypothetical protein